MSSYSSKESNDINNNYKITKALFNDTKYKQSKYLPPSHPPLEHQQQQQQQSHSSSSPSSHRSSIINSLSTYNEETTESNTHLISSKSKTKTKVKPKHSPTKRTSMSKNKSNLISTKSTPMSLSTVKSNRSKSSKKKSSSSAFTSSLHLLSDNSYSEESSNQSSLEESTSYNEPTQSIRQLSATIITPKITPPILEKSVKMVSHSNIDIKDIETVHSLFPLPPPPQPQSSSSSIIPTQSISMSNLSSSTRSDSYNCNYYYEYCKELANYYQMSPNIKYLYILESSIEYFNYNKICFGDYYILLRESHLLLDSFQLKDAEILFNEITRCYNTKREMNYGLLLFSFHFIAAERDCDVEVYFYYYYNYIN